MKRPGFLASSLVIGMVIVTAAAIVSQIDRKHPDPFTAARNGEAGHLSYHLTKDFDPNARNEDGETLLHLALGEEGNYQSVRIILLSGADPELDVNGEFPLHKAARANRLREARLLVEKGADPRRLDGRGLTPLHHIQGGNQAGMMVLQLVKAGAKLGDTDPSGLTARQHLARIGDPAVDRLIEDLGD